jgi:hypothetical protein
MFRNGLNATNVLQGNTINAVGEQPGTIVKHVTNTGSQVRTIDVELPIHKLFGLTQQQYLNQVTDSGARFGYNPNFAAYITFAAADSDAATAKTVKVDLKIIYHVECFARLSLPQS